MTDFRLNVKSLNEFNIYFWIYDFYWIKISF